MNHQKCGDHDCGKTNQWQYAPEHASYQCLEYCYPCRHGIIKIFALVMYYMSGPKNIDLVCKPMIPIPYKVSSKKKENPGNCVRFNIQNCEMLVDIIKYKKEETDSKYIEEPFCNSDIQVSHRFGILKKILTLSFRIVILEPDEEHEKRNSKC